MPHNWDGTGPPGGGDGVGMGLRTADGVGVAKGVDWPHDEARKTIAMQSGAAIAGEPIQRWAVIRVP